MLGWLFIFPIPLTVLMLRNKKLAPAIKYSITALGWVVYLIIGLLPALSGSDSTTTSDTANSIGIEVENTDVQVVTESLDDLSRLNNFFVSIPSFEVSEEEVKALAKENNLSFHSKLWGTGKATFKISYNSDIANQFATKETKGDYVLIEYNRLDKKNTSITYFNADKFYEGHWGRDSYSVTDFNSPDNARISVSSVSDIVNYIPVKPTGNNLLEDLFLQVTPEMTKEDVMTYVENNNLVYNPRGAGNEEYISYTSSIGEKFGSTGTTLIADFSSDEKVTKLTYYDYPVVYKTSTLGCFSVDNEGSEYYIADSEGITNLGSAQEVISAIQGLR